MRHLRFLKVVGHDVDIVSCSLEEMAALAKENDVPGSPDGLTIYRRSTIYLLEGQPEARVLDTLVHEIMHYMFDASGLREFIDNAAKAAYRSTFEETFVRIATPWVIEFITTNVRPLQVFDDVVPFPVSGAV